MPVNNTEVGVKVYTYIRKQEEAFAQKYPLVNMKESDIAGKVTGMLLRQPEPNKQKLNENMTYMVRRIIKAFEVLEEFYAKEVKGVKQDPQDKPSASPSATPAEASPTATSTSSKCRLYVDLNSPGITSGQLREALIEVHRVLDSSWMINGRKPAFIAPVLGNLEPKHIREIQDRCKTLAPLTIALRETLITEIEDGYALHALFHAPEFETRLKANFLKNLVGVQIGTPAAEKYDPYYPILKEFKCHAYWTVAVVKKNFQVALQKTKALLDTKYKSLFLVSKEIMWENPNGDGNKQRIKLGGTGTTGGMSLAALTQSAWRYKNHEFKTYAETIKKNVEEFGGTNITRVEGISWQADLAQDSSGKIG